MIGEQHVHPSAAEAHFLAQAFGPLARRDAVERLRREVEGKSWREKVTIPLNTARLVLDALSSEVRALPDRDRMTERQRAAWSGAIADLRQHAEVPDETYRWEFSWQQESRPGRGQMFSATWADGEHFAQIVMDVYGYPATSIAETDWLHSSSDEECGCDPCELARSDDND